MCFVVIEPRVEEANASELVHDKETPDQSSLSDLLFRYVRTIMIDVRHCIFYQFISRMNSSHITGRQNDRQETRSVLDRVFDSPLSVYRCNHRFFQLHSINTITLAIL